MVTDIDMKPKKTGTVTNATSTILVDAHAHIHKCFDLSEFLDAAAENFTTAASTLGVTGNHEFILCLTETSQAGKFNELCAIAQTTPEASVAPGSDWRINSINPKVNLSVNHPRFGTIHLVGGRQVVVAEKLEVLALGCTTHWPDGLPASELIEEISNAGGIAVLPWGFGKWLGIRGRILRSLIRKHSGQSFFLGDNSGRPVIFHEPYEFELATELGIKVLPGTDSLPIPSESNRAGSFGFHAEIVLSQQDPWPELCNLLLRSNSKIEPYGRLESSFRFIRNQLFMQFLNRTGGGYS